MIPLTKASEPAILRVKALIWTVNVLKYSSQGIKVPKLIQRKYNHKAVKQALIEETNNKCAYCESNVTHVYAGDIEHIIPKSVSPELTFAWTNLTFACSICNNLKSDYYDPVDSVLNPYIDQLSNHLTSAGALIIHIPGSRRGELTHALLELNRTILLERRGEAMKIFRTYLDRYANETISFLKEIYRKEIIDMIKPNKEFSFVLSNFLTFLILNGLITI
jgi:hypothetical protein